MGKGGRTARPALQPSSGRAPAVVILPSELSRRRPDAVAAPDQADDMLLTEAQTETAERVRVLRAYREEMDAQIADLRTIHAELTRRYAERRLAEEVDTMRTLVTAGGSVRDGISLIGVAEERSVPGELPLSDVVLVSRTGRVLRLDDALYGPVSVGQRRLLEKEDARPLRTVKDVRTVLARTKLAFVARVHSTFYATHLVDAARDRVGLQTAQVIQGQKTNERFAVYELRNIFALRSQLAGAILRHQSGQCFHPVDLGALLGDD